LLTNEDYPTFETSQPNVMSDLQSFRPRVQTANPDEYGAIVSHVFEKNAGNGDEQVRPLSPIGRAATRH
jgi:hypothetical protein